MSVESAAPANPSGGATNALRTTPPTAGDPPTDALFATADPSETGSGLEAETEDSAITVPFSPEKIRITTSPVLVQQILSRLEGGAMDLNPDFQRLDEDWDDQRRSRLIESLLLRIPIPVFYVSADENDLWRVVDGVQRISALRRFVANDFPLRRLEYLRSFEGRRHDGLPRSLQRRISETTFGFHIIEPGTPREVMFNIFTRLNTGGKPLNKQEIRNALHGGPVRQYLKKLAESDAFLRATDHSINFRRMADRELVLRFLSFHIESWENYGGGDLDDWMGTSMDRINAMDDPTRADFERDFTKAMNAASAVFGPRAFRRPFADGERRPPVNRALFDSWSVGLVRRSPAELDSLAANRIRVMEGLGALLQDPDFKEAISSSTGAVRRVRKRFRAVDDLIRRCLAGDAHP